MDEIGRFEACYAQYGAMLFRLALNQAVSYTHLDALSAPESGIIQTDGTKTQGIFPESFHIFYPSVSAHFTGMQ